MSRKVAEIAGRRLSLSNLEKDLYPSYGFTKAHILEYYRRIAPFILPHLKDRALTLKRYPERGGKGIFFREALSFPSSVLGENGTRSPGMRVSG